MSQTWVVTLRFCRTKRIKSVLSTSDILNKDKQKIQGNIRLNITLIKRVTYICMNPSLKSPTIYNNDDIDEYKRKEYARSRLSSHNLRIERGRWSRTSRNERLCTCRKNVQTEEHVFLFCELTEEIRTKYRITHVELDTFFQLDDRIITENETLTGHL